MRSKQMESMKRANMQMMKKKNTMMKLRGDILRI